MDPTNRFEIPQELRAMAESSFEQARKAFETFLSSAQQAANSFDERRETARANAKDFSARAIAFAEKNVANSLDYAEQLLKAKDLTQVMTLHSTYVQNQMKALAEQASEIGQAVTRAAMDMGKDLGKPK
jgi:phasin